ncbi:hypothetical protein ACHQM5_013082 [Ranunculus cassubicifolius]
MNISEEETSTTTLAFMELAVQQAQLALDNLEVSIGCIFVENQKRHEIQQDTLRWKQLMIYLKIGKKLDSQQQKLRKSFTCEPRILCASALSILGVHAVYYGCGNEKFGTCGSILSLHCSDKGFECTGGIMASEVVSLLRKFYEPQCT